MKISILEKGITHICTFNLSNEEITTRLFFGRMPSLEILEAVSNCKI